MISTIKEALIPAGGVRKDFAEDGTLEIDFEGWVDYQWGEYFVQREWY